MNIEQARKALKGAEKHYEATKRAFRAIRQINDAAYKAWREAREAYLTLERACR